MNLCLDSSVIAKLLLDERGSDEAIMLVEGAISHGVVLSSSELALYEVGNVLWKALRGSGLDGSRYVDELYDLGISFIPLDRGLAIDAMKVSIERDLTYYDSVHVSLSERMGSFLVTEDRELLERYDSALSLKGALEEL